ncbi:MAG TPA: M20 family metallopeptidase [Pyrinomonadaceae bacterium]|jgi:glutamate carboxypeptidase|nr:M20 family metallopeptidase [Pyrinomonadaceae bacterium]
MSTAMPLELDRDRARDLLEYFQSRRREVLALTRALVEQESPSGDLDGSRAVVQLLSESAQSVGAVSSLERIEAADNYGEHLRVRAFTKADPDARAILILGHTDTVHPRGSLRQRPWRESDGKIYGPGVFDMKAGCAAALEALRACDALGITPRRPVVLLLTCDEETGSFSGRALVEEEARRAEYVLVLEPPATGGRAKTARKGTGMFTLSVEGRAAHAGLEPEKGTSAVLEIARQIARLDGLNDAATGTTVNVGVVSGGTRSNVVAAEARAEIDVRFGTIEEARRVEEAIRSLTAFDSRARLSIEGEINRPPMERTSAVAELYRRARAIAAALDFELGETSVGGASDGNFAAACGAAVLDGLGIDGDGAHADDEHIDADAVTRRGALLAALLGTL